MWPLNQHDFDTSGLNHWQQTPVSVPLTELAYRTVPEVLAPWQYLEAGRRWRWQRRRQTDKTAHDQLHVTLRPDVCSSSRSFTSRWMLHSCMPRPHSAPGHDHMPVARPTDQRRSGLAWQLAVLTLRYNSSDRWVKRWATSCVKWTEGTRGLAIKVKQTERVTDVCVCVCGAKQPWTSDCDVIIKHCGLQPRVLVLSVSKNTCT